MNTLLKEFEDMGCKVEVGWKEKNRKKNNTYCFKKIKGKWR